MKLLSCWPQAGSVLGYSWDTSRMSTSSTYKGPHVKAGGPTGRMGLVGDRAKKEVLRSFGACPWKGVLTRTDDYKSLSELNFVLWGSWITKRSFLCTHAATAIQHPHQNPNQRNQVALDLNLQGLPEQLVSGTVLQQWKVTYYFSLYPMCLSHFSHQTVSP